MSKDNEELESLTESASFIKELREFAITVGEDCPEGHRRDPSSGRCLPIGGQDHTAFTRSLNDEQGPEWRGEVVREENDQKLASVNAEVAIDAENMDSPESCAEGTTFSFIQRRCIPTEEAEEEDSDELAFEENEEDAAAPGKGGHPEIVQMQPEGRRDTVNHDCPPNMMFDFVLRECIPLNKDSKMKASASEEKGTGFGRVARTSPDPIDGHTHMVTVDMDGNGMTSVAIGGIVESYPHSHKVVKFEVMQHAIGEESSYISRHPGFVNPMEMDGDYSNVFGDTKFASLATIEGVDFGLPEKKMFPLNTKEKAEQVINAFDQLKKDLSPAEQTTLLHNLTIAASKYGIAEAFSNLPTVTATPEWFTKVFNKEFQRVIASIEEEDKEEAKPLGSQRKALPNSSFGVPAKRKFPLDSCNRVRNAMSRFNQAKGLTSSEKATLRRKVLARAKACGIEVQNFAKATTEAEFTQVVVDLRRVQTAEINSSIEERYSAKKEEGDARGPCPPGMIWDPVQKRCGRTQGLVDIVKANHSDIVSKQPEGRRDTVGHQCPPGQFFDYGQRKCLPLDPSKKEGTTTEKAQRDLAPDPKGKPARLPQDCPSGTIWDKKLQRCIPLDSSKKTKSEEEEAALPDFIKKIMEKKKGKNGDDKKGKKGKKGFPFAKKSKSEEEEAKKHGEMPDFIKKIMDKKKGKNGEDDKKKKGKKGNPFGKKTKSEEEDEDAQTTSVGPGKQKDDHGCDTATETYDVKTEKCVKSRTAKADANPSNREGLTVPPAGKVQHQSDCPPNTAWDSKMKICRPISSMDKDRPSGASPQSPKSTADDVEKLTPARLIQELDRILSEQDENKARPRINAKDLPNAAFPPSTVNATKRVLMHHTPDVADPYDTATVDIGRLRNALARANRVEDFSEKAIEDALEHLLYHAREIVTAVREKKE